MTLADASIRVERRFEYPPEKVWEALTTPRLLARWWAPGDIKPTVGHSFVMDMGRWGAQLCEVIEVEPQKILRFRFSTDRLNTTISWHLRPEGTATVLTLTQQGFDLDSPIARAAFNGMKPGWPKVLERLSNLLVDICGK